MTNHNVPCNVLTLHSPPLPRGSQYTRDVTDACWQQNRLLGVQVALASPEPSWNPAVRRRQWRFLEAGVQGRRLDTLAVGPLLLRQLGLLSSALLPLPLGPAPHCPGHPAPRLCPVKTSPRGSPPASSQALCRSEFSSKSGSVFIYLKLLSSEVHLCESCRMGKRLLRAVSPPPPTSLMSTEGPSALTFYTHGAPAMGQTSASPAGLLQGRGTHHFTPCSISGDSLLGLLPERDPKTHCPGI